MSARPSPQGLEFSPPACSICDNETTADPDGFDCYDCGASWDTDGNFTGWDAPGAEQCLSTDYNPWNEVTHRCILAVGHKGCHADGTTYMPWTDETAGPTPTEPSPAVTP